MVDLVLLSTVKEYLGVGTAHSDDELQAMLSGASARIRRCIDPIETTTYTEEAYDGNGKDVLLLRHWPVLGVVAVTVDDEAVTDFKFYRDGRLYYSEGFTEGRQNVEVTYSAGYGAAVPEDLKLACLMLVKFYAKSELSARSVFFEGGGGMGAERAMPMQVRDILEAYPSYQAR